MYKKDPTLPVSNCFSQKNKKGRVGLTTNPSQAKSHGNTPSKGAQIDAEIQAEEEQQLKKKGQNLPGKKN
jgi:hypothetical protein